MFSSTGTYGEKFFDRLQLDRERRYDSLTSRYGNRGVARLSVMPGQTNLSVVTKYNLWEGHTCIHKKMFFLCMAWLATVNSTCMVHKIRSICIGFFRKLCYLLLHDYYYSNKSKTQTMHAFTH